MLVHALHMCALVNNKFCDIVGSERDYSPHAIIWLKNVEKMPMHQFLLSIGQRQIDRIQNEISLLAVVQLQFDAPQPAIHFILRELKIK